MEGQTSRGTEGRGINKRDQVSVGPTQNPTCKRVSQLSDTWTQWGRKVCQEQEQIQSRILQRDSPRCMDACPHVLQSYYVREMKARLRLSFSSGVNSSRQRTELVVPTVLDSRPCGKRSSLTGGVRLLPQTMPVHEDGQIASPPRALLAAELRAFTGAEMGAEAVGLVRPSTVSGAPPSQEWDVGRTGRKRRGLPRPRLLQWLP